MLCTGIRANTAKIICHDKIIQVNSVARKLFSHVQLGKFTDVVHALLSINSYKIYEKTE